MVDDTYINLILEQGLSKEEAYKKVFAKECEGKSESEITSLSTKRLNRKDNLTYYNAKLAEYEIQAKEKVEWNRDVANASLKKLYDSLMERALNVNDPNEKMSVLQTIVNIAKELNLINGLQEHKLTIDVNPIQSVNINKLKTYDENGNIVDVDFKEEK